MMVQQKDGQKIQPFDITFEDRFLQPQFKPGFTNTVFSTQKSSKIIHFLPVYMRMKIKNIIGMDFFTLDGEINCTIILSIFYGSLSQQIITMLSTSIQLAFHRSQTLLLKADDLQVDLKRDKDKRLLNFTVRRIVSTKIQGDVFWSPFQMVRFIISVTIRSINYQQDQLRHVFKFNFMDTQDIDTKFSLADQQYFGMFKIADKMLEVDYSNQFAYKPAQKKQQNLKKNLSKLQQDKTRGSTIELLGVDDQQQVLIAKYTIQNFHYAHFILPMYKKPWPSILTIYFPLLLLGIINMAIFYQDVTNVNNIMGNIILLLVSFVALIPTVRQQSPVSPIISFTEIIVFVQAFTTVLTFIHMLVYMNYQGFQEDLAQDGWLIACLVINAIILFLITAMILLHKVYWKKMYHRSDQDKKKATFKFNHKNWVNKKCDQYFNKLQLTTKFIFQPQQVFQPLKTNQFMIRDFSKRETLDDY